MKIYFDNGLMVETDNVTWSPEGEVVTLVVLDAKDLREMAANRKNSNINDLYIDNWAESCSKKAKRRLGDDSI